MIKEDYVSFEVAKLLKEKWFDADIGLWYDKDGNIFVCHRYEISRNWRVKAQQEVYFCPTLQMAMKWLREVHNIFIQVDYIWSPKELYTYTFDIHNMKNARSILSTPYGESFDSYEEAYDVAIKYCLTNLI